MGWKFDKKNDHIEDFFEGMLPHVKRFLQSLFKWSDLSHAYVNLFVEAARLSAYHSGHIFAFVNLLYVFIIGYALYHI